MSNTSLQDHGWAEPSGRAHARPLRRKLASSLDVLGRWLVYHQPPRRLAVVGLIALLALITQSGEYEHRGAHITAGEFDWVVSQIEQDDIYRGGHVVALSPSGHQRVTDPERRGHLAFGVLLLGSPCYGGSGSKLGAPRISRGPFGGVQRDRMIDRMSVGSERRQHLRIAPKGTVLLLANEYAQPGRIGNLSQGGLLVRTTTTAPSRLLDQAVDIEIRLDGQLAEWLRASGKIIRIGAGKIAIAFDTIPVPLVRLIDEMSAASRTRLRVLSAVLIDTNLLRRSVMAEGFRAAGCAVLEISTPLEAIVRLGESSFEPDLIAIADSIPDTVTSDLRVFVERDHPCVKLVTIGDDAVEPVGIAHWLSSANPGSDLVTRIRRVLGASSMTQS